MPAAILFAGGVFTDGMSPGGVIAGDGSGRHSEKQSGPAPAVVLFAPVRPVFLRLRVQLDGETVNNRQTGPPLVLSAQTETGGEADASLFQHLDLNGDGVLTADELRKARETLAPLDADDDETISIAELAAASQNRGSRSDGRANTRRLPLMMLGPDTSADSIAEALLREYGSGAKPGDRRLDAAALGLAPQDIRPFDGAGDGRLGASELAKLVLGLPPQLELSFELFDQRRGRPRVSVAPGKRPPAFEWQQSSADAATLVVNGLRVALSAKRTRSSVGDMSRFYALRFNIVDADKNNYLDRKEFAALGLPDADFTAVDANGDGQIVPTELANYLKRKAGGQVDQVLVAVSDESKSLFNFLDTRPDGRLCPRELNAAAARLAELDKNKDGQLTLGELRTQIRIEVEARRPSAPRPNILVAGPRSQSPTVVPRDRGPEWFLRMDRNYDGDVSWREFLGPRQVFDQLDADHDGLLSPEEAERAK